MPVSRSPISTDDPGGWSVTGAATAHEAVDIANDGDAGIYIACTDGSTVELGLDPVDHPNELAGHSVTAKLGKFVDTSQTCTARLELMEGASVISTADVDCPDPMGSVALNPTEAEVAAIVDYAALSFRITDLASPLTSEIRAKSVVWTVPDRRLRAHVSG